VQKRFEVKRPLQTVQIDHAQVDVVVVDEDSGDELGRPWIAMGIDAATRVVTGFHLTMTPPTRLSASLCLLHSVCDKTRWLEERRVPFEWPVSGLPETVVTDANSFFGPRAFVRACRQVGVRNVWNAERDAKYGAHIESLIGTRLGDAPLITDMASTDRSEREGCGRRHAPRFTLFELEAWLAAQITGAYHRKRHPALRRAPIAAWRALAPETSIRAPVDCVSFRLSFLPEEECELHARGVNLLGRCFSSRALAADFEVGRRKSTVKYDPRDLSRIFVQRPSGRFVKAFAADTAEKEAPTVSGRAADARALIGDPSPDLWLAEYALADGSRRRPEARPNGQNARELLLAAGSGAVSEWDEDAAVHRAAGDNPGSDDAAAPQDFDGAAQAHACSRKCLVSCPFQRVER
jgi:putative transposase